MTEGAGASSDPGAALFTTLDEIPLDVQSLLFAVLVQATQDLAGIFLGWENKFKEHKWRKNAREWFEGEGDEPFSFVWTCEHLGLDPSDYRRRVFKIVKEDPGRLAFLYKRNIAKGSERRPRRSPHRASNAPPALAV